MLDAQALAAIAAALSRSHTLTCDLTLTDGKPSGTIRIRPRRKTTDTSAAPSSTTNNATTSPPLKTPEAMLVEQSRAALMSIGIDSRTAHGLALQFPHGRIMQVIEKAKNTRSPSGFAVDALRKGWLISNQKTGS